MIQVHERTWSEQQVLKTSRIFKFAKRGLLDHQCEMLFFPICTSYNVPLLEAAKNFTLLIKNHVQFPKFGEST